MQWKINRTWRVVLSVFVLLVAFRLALPYIVTRYVNNVLSSLEGYNGMVKDVSIQLFRGAYQLDSLRIYKENSPGKIPFVSIPLTDISIEWESMLHGTFVSEIAFHNAALNFIVGKKDSSLNASGLNSIRQTGKENDWSKALKKLLLADLNRLRIVNGKIAVYDYSSVQRTDIVFSNLHMDALNLDNANNNIEKLPSRIYLQALSTGNGQLNIALRLNPMKRIPDLDMDLRFENVNLKALSELLGADMEKGNLNLYSELSVMDGKITGYVKPLFTDLEVNQEEAADNQTADLVWGSMVSFLTEVFEKQQKKQFVTSIPLDADIHEAESPFLASLWNVFSTSFTEAFETRATREIRVATFSRPKKTNDPQIITEAKKSKKDLRKEKRREKREERKSNKKERKEKNGSQGAFKKSTGDKS